MAQGRRGGFLAGTVVVVLLSLWCGWLAVSELRFQSDFERVRAEVASGQLREAKPWLKAHPAARSHGAELAYWLGLCEHADGNHPAAVAAWSRVPADSPLSITADLARARTLVGDLGRYADAEVILEAALRKPGPRQVEVRHTLSQLYFEEGRRGAMRRVLRDGWNRSPQPAAELRDLWMVDNATTQLPMVAADVGEAGRKAPDDDRVWLAKANLALQTGKLDEAADWLDRCQARRADDPAVWRARLDLARTKGDLARARLTLPHLPAGHFTAAEVESLRAWLAGQEGDADRERQALERLVEIDPGETRALERLGTIYWESGRPEKAREYRRLKGEIDYAKERMFRLLEQRVPSKGFAELARLSEVLGRTFEAVGWWTLSARFENDGQKALEALARLRLRPEPPNAPEGVTLASLLPEKPAREVAKKPSAVAAGRRIPEYEDASESSGLRFTFENGRSPERQLPETTAGGVALIDYDGDGRLDVFCIQGGTFPPSSDRPGSGDRLFRNRGDGTFEDATERSGIAAMARGYGHGVAVGDYDDDGRADLFLTRWRSYALYHNRGDGTFEDATATAGFGGDRDWPTSAAFADLDNDGDLDLYVCHYLEWDAGHPRLCERAASAGEKLDPARRFEYCMPNPIPALPDHLFRNDGGRFVDVTAEAGIVDANGRGLGVVAGDVDGDGLVDLFVANDTTANYLFHNLGGMKFEEVGFASGVASNADGAFQAGMGTAFGDLDRDGLPDLSVTNFFGESTTFYRNLGGGMFSDRTAAVGLAAPSRYRLGFGLAFLDANNDGHLDLASACGHVIDNRPLYPYAMPSQLLIGDGKTLTDVTESAGTPWNLPRISRGLAVGDLDNDGRLDTVLVPQDGPIVYARNRTKGGHFVTFQLQGTASNRDAVGAVVTVNPGGKGRTAWRFGGGSFQSAADGRLHFGLDDLDKVESVEVRWPSGRTNRYGPLAADKGYRLREGDDKVTPLTGYQAR